MAEPMETERHSAEGAAYKWALRVSAISLAVLALVGAVVAGILQGSSGVWGVLAGGGLAALAGLVTQGAMLAGYRRPPHIFASIVGGSWLWS